MSFSMEDDFSIYLLSLLLSSYMLIPLEKCGAAVEHLCKGKTGRFAKTISFSQRASDGNCCHIEVGEEKVNLGNGEGLQIPCKHNFTGVVKLQK